MCVMTIFCNFITLVGKSDMPRSRCAIMTYKMLIILHITGCVNIKISKITKNMSFLIALRSHQKYLFVLINFNSQ